MPSPTGRILNTVRFCTDDGPGIRTTVFLKGCPLRCAWCHNPESQAAAPEIEYNDALCRLCGACAAACPADCHALSPEGHAFRRESCRRCGACARVCAAGSLVFHGQDAAPEDILRTVLRDKVFYDTSGGGVTLSGGEPLMQPAFSARLLALCRDAGIHTALETCGYASEEVFDRVCAHADLLLFDLKAADPGLHRALTGADNAPILANLRRADAARKPYVLRLPLIPGANDSEEALNAMRKCIDALSHCTRVQVMPFHKLGEYKYRALGKPYTLPPTEEPGEDVKARWRTLLERG